MSSEDDLTPRLGRIGNRGAAGSKRFSRQVRAAEQRSRKPRGKSRFTGRQSGRGAAVARQLEFTRARWQALRVRRVTVKVHIARAGKSSGIGAFKAHLHYVQRDGVEREGQGGDLYCRAGEVPDASGFLERSEHDRHQFRIIVSPEDGEALGDLKETTRALIKRMEHDLGTRLDWVAVDHHNTGHPHTHIIVRGKDQRSADLIIAPDYLTSGLRTRAQEIATDTLGPRRDVEIARARQSEIGRDRFTGIDRALLAEMSEGEVHLDQSPETPASRFDRSLKLQRLAHLEGLGFATEIELGRWRMTPGWSDQLDSLGRRNDVIATLAAKFGREDGQERLRTFDERKADKGRLLGTVLTGLPDDEFKGTRSLVIEDFEGERWLVNVGAPLPGTSPSEGAIVDVGVRIARPRPSDQTISAVAARNGGYYSEDLHREADPASTAAYRTAHTRRLEALRRAGLVERRGDGIWHVPEDYLQKAAGFERSRRAAFNVQVRSWISLEDQIERRGLTWLDEARDGAAGDRLASARQSRIAWLREQGLLGADETELRPEVRAELVRIEKANVSVRLAGQASRTARELEQGDTLAGRYEGVVDLGHRRMAVIGNGHEFALVPWRPEIERHRGREMIARHNANGLSWTIGTVRERGLSR